MINEDFLADVKAVHLPHGTLFIHDEGGLAYVPGLSAQQYIECMTPQVVVEVDSEAIEAVELSGAEQQE